MHATCLRAPVATAPPHPASPYSPACVWLLAAALAGCAGGPQRAAPGRDGAEPNPPPDLARVPDAQPRLEPIRPGGANKPYDVFGHSYVPITQDAPYTERGLASWYGTRFHGRRTASGEVYNMYAMTAAHKTLPIPSYARVRNPANGREIVVRINDRGPFHSERILDLSYTAALKLDLLRNVAPIELQRITFEEIRTGAWRRDGDALRLAAGDGRGSAKAEAPVVAAAAIAPAAASTSNAASASEPPASSAPATAPAPVSAAPPSPERVAPMPAASPQPATIAVAAASVDAVAATSADVARAPAIAPAPPPPPASPPPAAAVEDAPAARAYTTPARGYWVQLGAFRLRDGAVGFQKRVIAEMDWLEPLLAVFSDAAMYRLQAGPYPSREEARGVAERVRDGLKLVPVIVERR